MDDIQRVDCFERLRQFLLRHEPDLQARIQSLCPDRFRQADLSFFLSHLVALLSGLDDQTAEGKRRIRRFLAEMDRDDPAEWAHRKQIAIREQGGVWEKPLSESQRNQLRKSFANLRNLAPDPADTGVAFAREIDRAQYPPDQIEWLRRLLPCLSNLNLFRFLNRLGHPILLPDSRSQAFLFRLGLLSKTGGTLRVQLETCRIAQAVADALQSPIHEIDFCIRAFVGSIPGFPPDAVLCGRIPTCKPCPLQPYCHYFRFSRPPAQGASEPLPIKQWRQTDRPRERLVQLGPQSLEDTELLAIVLRTGSGGVNVLELARRLLERFGTLQAIEEASLEDLRKIRGIGQMKAIELKAVLEIGRRLIFNPVKPGDTFSCSDDIYRGYSARFAHVKQEEFILLMLNSKNQVIREEVVSRGSLNAAIVHPREVFKAAIRASAAAVVFIHNHPSGDPTPSHDDFVITQRLEQAAEFLQIRVLDHLVIGSGAYYSFSDGEVVRPAE